jgi:hypothetical protein
MHQHFAERITPRVKKCFGGQSGRRLGECF